MNSIDLKEYWFKSADDYTSEQVKKCWRDTKMVKRTINKDIENSINKFIEEIKNNIILHRILYCFAMLGESVCLETSW